MQQRAKERYEELRGDFSVWMPQWLNTTICFGKYETAFNQFIFNGSIWIVTDEGWAMLPKINGLGVMV